MRLKLTHAQIEEIRPFLKHGQALLARIGREVFDGTNGDTSGTPTLEFGPVPEASLPTLRQAIIEARNPKPKKRKAMPK
jgi:hypothetical protein